MEDTSKKTLADGEDISPEEFDRYLEDSLNARDSYSPGDRVKGTVVYITKENAFVDISGKTEATIEIGEFRDSKGNITIKKGDVIDAYVVSTARGEIILTSRIGKGSMNSLLLETALEDHVPVQGVPTAVVKGGYTVMIGDLRCFCPFSQIALKAPENPEELLNRSVEFLVTRIEENGRNIVLSRRALLEEKRQKDIDSLKKTIKTGDVVTGKISSVQSFGLLVNLGAVEALVPRSEITRGRSPETIAFVQGQEIRAQVMTISWDENRIVLSLKALEADPWDSIDRYSEGQSITGCVVNIINSGAFVELESGLEGYLPVSRMSVTKKITRPEDAVSKGSTVQVRITNINRKDRKLALELITGEVDPWAGDDTDFASSTQTAIIESAKPNGLQVRLANGMGGYVPKEDLLQKTSDIPRAYPAGTTITLAIKEMDREKKRLILSETLAVKREQEGEYKAFARAQESTQAAGSASPFKDKLAELKKKLDEGRS